MSLFAADVPVISVVAPSEVSQSVVVSSDKSAVEKTEDTLKAVDEKIPLEVKGGILAAIVFALELLLRFLPTKKPKSLILGIGSIFKIIGSIFSKISSLIDKVGQNLKEDK